MLLSIVESPTSFISSASSFFNILEVPSITPKLNLENVAKRCVCEFNWKNEKSISGLIQICISISVVNQSI